MAIRKCGNCKNRHYADYSGVIEDCHGYRKTKNEEEEILQATDCNRYVKGTPDCIMYDHVMKFV